MFTKQHTAIIVVTNSTSLRESTTTTTQETGFNAIEAGYTYLALERLRKEYPQLQTMWVSPRGGQVHMSPQSRQEAERCEDLKEHFIQNEQVQRQLRETKRPDEGPMDKCCLAIFIGGHGALNDFPKSQTLATLTTKIWFQNRGLLAAIAQGASVFLDVKDESGQPFVKGKKITCMSNEEEKKLSN